MESNHRLAFITRKARYIENLWARLDLNQGPSYYKYDALTAELRAQNKVILPHHEAKMKIKALLFEQLLPQPQPYLVQT